MKSPTYAKHGIKLANALDSTSPKMPSLSSLTFVMEISPLCNRNRQAFWLVCPFRFWNEQARRGPGPKKPGWPVVPAKWNRQRNRRYIQHEHDQIPGFGAQLQSLWRCRFWCPRAYCQAIHLIMQHIAELKQGTLYGNLFTDLQLLYCHEWTTGEWFLASGLTKWQR